MRRVAAGVLGHRLVPSRRLGRRTSNGAPRRPAAVARFAAILGGAAALAACVAPNAPEGPALSVVVAPLDLQGVTNATYTLTVKNESGAQVWTRTVDADRYGDGVGAVSYVGPCDADDDPSGDGVANNGVELELVGLDGSAGALVAGLDFANPAPVGSPVSRTVACREGEDTPVSFELAVVQRAQQGFFDVAVTFSNIFCSAKLDCVKDDGPDAGSDPDPLELLFNASGQRDRTVVMALACTSGPGTDTHLYMNDVVIRCDGAEVATLAPVEPAGNKGAMPPLVFQHALYFGVEQLNDGGGQSYAKAYWNLAIGIDEGALASLTGPCVLSTDATATPAALDVGATAAGAVWPRIVWEVTLAGAGATALSCGRHAVNVPGSGVSTAYAEGQAFAFAFAPDIPGGGANARVQPVVAAPTCADGVQNGDETGVDCGGATCDACPTCSDSVQNGDETGVDCGGGTCAACALGSGCDVDADCLSGVCAAGVCGSLSEGSDFVQVASAFYHTCGLKSDGTLACWGSTSGGRTPAPAGTYSALAINLNTSCAIGSGGALTCWGPNTYNQATPPSGSFIQVSAGQDYACAVRSDHAVLCWGHNGNGQTNVVAGSYQQVATGAHHTCALTTGGTVVCWGYVSAASQPPALTFTQISTGYRHGCGRRPDSTVVCWGENTYGESTSPSGTFVQIEAGEYQTCGVRPTGALECWGWNNFGQSTPPAGTYAAVSSGSAAVNTVNGNGMHACALRTDSTIVCWGDQIP